MVMESGISVFSKPVVLPPRRFNRKKQHQLDLARARAEAEAKASAVLIARQPGYDLHLRHDEMPYFNLFRVQTASQLSGYFNSNFWTHRVLQECHFEPAIRHAVVAMGALYKTLELSTEKKPRQQRLALADKTAVAVTTTTNVSLAIAHWQVAVKQYSEACNAIMSISGSGIRHYRTRLMAIILLACFDSFIGDHKQGIVQIQTGLGIVDQYHASRAESSSPTAQQDVLEDDLVMLFTRLAIQAKSYDMAFHFPMPYVIRLSSPSTSSPPSQHPSSPGSDSSSASPSPSSGPFASLVEARLASDKLIESLLKFIEALQLAKSDPSYVLPAAWKKYGMGLKDKLSAWSDAFEPIFQSRMDPGTTHIERSGISALKMFQVNANILFLMMFCDTEVQFDAFMPHFKTIVDLGWEVVAQDERRAALGLTSGGFLRESVRYVPTISPDTFARNSGPRIKDKAQIRILQPSFSADLGIVPPLYVVATKCRDPNLRRQAIHILRSSARREGMWDSELTARIAEWVMLVEEHDPLNPARPAYDANRDSSAAYNDVPKMTIPEERRIMVKSVDFDLRARYADVRVGTRAIGSGGQDFRERQTRITW